MTFTGRFKYQANENYEEYLALMDMGWLQRKKLLHMSPDLIINEISPGKLKYRTSKKSEKLIVLGEERPEVLPNGEKVEAVTVREGDNCLITRFKDPCSLEFREEFTPQGMTQFIRYPDHDLEAIRYFKRC